MTKGSESFSNIPYEDLERMYENTNWEEAKERIHEISRKILYEDSLDSLEEIGYGVNIGSAMREFAQERFDEEVETTGSVWEILYQKVKNQIKNLHLLGDPKTPEYYSNMLELWKLVAPLKELDPESFARNDNIEDEHWNKIAEWLNTECRGSLSSIGKAHTIDAQKIAELLPTNKDDWEAIREGIRNEPIAIKAQNIKPEGFPDITISQEEWKDMKKTVLDLIANGSYASKVFKYIQELEDKEIKVEEDF